MDDMYGGDFVRLGEAARPMGPLIGLVPDDGVWRGDLPIELVEAVYDAVQDDLIVLLKSNPELLTSPDDLGEFVGSIITLSAMRTSERLFAELGGCVIGEGPQEGS